MASHLPYPKGDLRRMLTVLAAIELLPVATIQLVAEEVGLDRRTVKHLIDQARDEACVSIRKDESVYSIISWGPVLRKEAAIKALRVGLFPESDR
jgi:DNA-binding transcriptional regulator LsrR (DeoR family)